MKVSQGTGCYGEYSTCWETLYSIITSDSVIPSKRCAHSRCYSHGQALSLIEPGQPLNFLASCLAATGVFPLSSLEAHRDCTRQSSF